MPTKTANSKFSLALRKDEGKINFPKLTLKLMEPLVTTDCELASSSAGGLDKTLRKRSQQQWKVSRGTPCSEASPMIKIGDKEGQSRIVGRLCP